MSTYVLYFSGMSLCLHMALLRNEHMPRKCNGDKFNIKPYFPLLFICVLQNLFINPLGRATHYSLWIIKIIPEICRYCGNTSPGVTLEGSVASGYLEDLGYLREESSAF